MGIVPITTDSLYGVMDTCSGAIRTAVVMDTCPGGDHAITAPIHILHTCTLRDRLAVEGITEHGGVARGLCSTAAVLARWDLALAPQLGGSTADGGAVDQRGNGHRVAVHLAHQGHVTQVGDVAIVY